MRKIKINSLIYLLILILIPAMTWAQTPTEFWYSAADIIKRNINSPELAISELDGLINHNSKVLQTWYEETEETRRLRNKFPKQEELLRVKKDIYEDGLNQAINEWIGAISFFAEKHPHYLDRINLLLKSYIPNP
ncbi:MAG: hypothetical protein JW867_08870 [Candidatus Omnitrophica bacterium]|nr:hypothetical protein [Candidatus Omnitrophota bacterium]